MPSQSPPQSGFYHVPGFLSSEEQNELLDIARSICKIVPLQRPCLPNGTPMKLTLTNCGAFGWWSDRAGYRYIDKHPNGSPFPPIPDKLIMHTERALDYCNLSRFEIQNCLINHYAQGESLGMHIDRTEQDKNAPIVSFSLGADAEFILNDGEKNHSFFLRSGDLVIQSGPSRGWLHGIKRIMPTMPNVCRDGGRLNFTLRKVCL